MLKLGLQVRTGAAGMLPSNYIAVRVTTYGSFDIDLGHASRFPFF